MSTTTIKEKTRRPRVVAGLTPYTGTFDKEQITHLLKRTMFGAKKSDVDFFTGKTLTEVINTLLTEPPALTDADLPLRNYAASTQSGVLDDIMPIGTTWTHAIYNNNYNGQRVTSLKSWWGGKMIHQPRSIFEKMVLFWHNHFATEMDQSTSHLSYKHLMTLRQYAMGNFKDFTKAITLDPNMLRYLNGYLNTKTAPDENYGRELQELFTAGKGPNSGYTEADVKAAARVLTGWKFKEVENPVGSGKYEWVSYMLTSSHDTTAKTFSAFYGNTVISNTANTEAGAIKELDDMLTMIFATNEVGMYVCRRLYRFFVYYEIDATIEAEVITPMADIFRQANYDIKPVLKALFSSEHFFEVGIKACLIKSPLEFAIGLCREFNMDIPTTITTVTTDIPILYNAWYNITIGDRLNGPSTQAQNLGDPPNVSGWSAYYQVPDFHEAWINTDTFPKRLRYSDTLMSSAGYNIGGGKKLIVDFVKFTDSFGADASDPNMLISSALEVLYRVPPTNAMLAYLKTNILLDGQASDHYWSDAWDAYKASPTTANFNIVNIRLQKFYTFIVRNPEYQLA